MRYKASHLKIYREGIYVVVTSTEAEALEVITWYKARGTSQNLGELRSGVLIKKTDD